MIIDEKEAKNYEVMIDGNIVSLTLLISRHRERNREIDFNLEINRKSQRW